MKNVIVFALGRARYAVELRWVREVVTLGYVTPIPTAPAAVVGAVNVGGTVTPVLELQAALGEDDDIPSKPPRRGDGAILLEVEGLQAAVRVRNVVTVTTLLSGKSKNTLDDGTGSDIPLIDAPDLLSRAHAQVAASRPPEPARMGDHG